MKVLIVCGGSGGHIYPGLALAKVFEQQGDKVMFIGAHKMEMAIVPKYGYSIVGVSIAGLNRRNIKKNFLLPFKILRSIFQSLSIIKTFRPDVIIGMGGYVQFPVVMAGYISRVPIYLQEQNSVPGLSNKLCKMFAKKIFTAFFGLEQYFGKKAIFTGNPTLSKPNQDENSKEEAHKYFMLTSKKPVILFLGGSLGAENIINFVFEHTDDFLKKDLQVILSAGKNNIISKFASTFSWIKVLPYIERMDYAYAISTIVVSRAGSLSLSELSNNYKASIIIPSPNVTNNHQYKNAKQFEDKDAIILLKEEDMNKKLMDTIFELIENKEKRSSLENNIGKFSQIDAAKKIVAYIKNENK